MASRAQVFAGAALVLIGFALGTRLVRGPAREPKAPARAPAFTAPVEPEPLLPASSPPAERSPAAPPARELSFARIMDILGAETSKPELAPAARKFKEEFLAKPELRKTYEEFKERADRGEEPAAASFLQALRALPSFRNLVARFGAGGGRATILAISREPEIKRLLTEEKAQRAAVPAAAAGTRAPVARSPVSSFGPVAGAKPVVGAAPSAARGYGAAGTGPAALSGGAGAIAAGQGAQVAGGWQAAESGPGGANLGSKAGGIATSLGKIQAAQSGRMAKLLEVYPWLKGLGPDLQKLIAGDLIDRFGLWGACFSLKIYAKCQAACVSGGCQPKAGWDACMEWKSSDAACAQECALQPGCAAPGAGGGGNCGATDCSPESLACWTRGIGLSACVGEQYCAENGRLPATLPELVNWGNSTGRRDPATTIWRCR